MRDYKWSVFAGGIWVPFVAAYPGVFPAGLVCSHPVSTLDVFPTVMALTGAKPPLELDGVNLTPYLKGEKKEPSHDALFFAMDGNGAVRQNQWKLVRTADGISHLFDLEKDVEEKTDLAGPEAERVKDLQAKWQAWNAQMPIAVKKSITEKASITDHINDLIND